MYCWHWLAKKPVNIFTIPSAPNQYKNINCYRRFEKKRRVWFYQNITSSIRLNLELIFCDNSTSAIFATNECVDDGLNINSTKAIYSLIHKNWLLTFHVPNPNCGIFKPLFNVMLGTCGAIVSDFILWKITEREILQKQVKHMFPVSDKCRLNQIRSYWA